MRVIYDNTKMTYSKETKTITVSEKHMQGFAVKYELYNLITSTEKQFILSYSTGQEFDPNTKWIHKSNDGFTLEVCNDKAMTKLSAKSYLKHKMQN